jgi:hypothetical protein
MDESGTWSQSAIRGVFATRTGEGMTKKTVPPALGAESFSCPHCGALAHQTWLDMFATPFAKDQKPPSMPDSTMFDNVRKSRDFDDATKKRFTEYLERLSAREIFLNGQTDRYRIQWVANLHLSKCFSCSSRTAYSRSRFKLKMNARWPRCAAISSLFIIAYPQCTAMDQNPAPRPMTSLGGPRGWRQPENKTHSCAEGQRGHNLDGDRFNEGGHGRPCFRQFR